MPRRKNKVKKYEKQIRKKAKKNPIGCGFLVFSFLVILIVNPIIIAKSNEVVETLGGGDNNNNLVAPPETTESNEFDELNQNPISDPDAHFFREQNTKEPVTKRNLQVQELIDDRDTLEDVTNATIAFFLAQLVLIPFVLFISIVGFIYFAVNIARFIVAVVGLVALNNLEDNGIVQGTFIVNNQFEEDFDAAKNATIVILLFTLVQILAHAYETFSSR
eukprot:snap_masked-scaffold_10-processed-gene-8.15-mRNA-1 protein AED:1.00 eAED:1.00 QI:0/-1/0/0/-1/1/1/0/218